MSGPHKYRRDALMPKGLHLANRYLTEASRVIIGRLMRHRGPPD
jgi:hypothetical protein